MKKKKKKLDTGKLTIANLSDENAAIGGNTVTCDTGGCCKFTVLNSLCYTMCNEATDCYTECTNLVDCHGCDEPDW